jgi:predicted transcriptional regulator
MNKMPPLSVQLDTAVSERLTAVAAALQKPESWVVEQAIKDFIDLREWQMAAIDEGVRQADAGQLISHDKVVAWVESWGRPDELPMPTCD